MDGRLLNHGLSWIVTMLPKLECAIFAVFCFKQKTAYELRISDWSSDVCSSDLHALHADAELAQMQCHGFPLRFRIMAPDLDRIVVRWNRAAVPPDNDPLYFQKAEQLQRAADSPQALPSHPSLISVHRRVDAQPHLPAAGWPRLTPRPAPPP